MKQWQQILKYRSSEVECSWTLTALHCHCWPLDCDEYPITDSHATLTVRNRTVAQVTFTIYIRICRKIYDETLLKKLGGAAIK